MRLDCVPDQATLRGRQSGSGAERRDTFWGGTQTHGQGRSLASGDSLRQSAKGPYPLNAQAAGGCADQAHRTQEPVARDGSAAPGREWPQAWRKDMWCILQVDGEYVARMEDVLDLDAEAPDPRRPAVCYGESPVQLIGEARQPIVARPSRTAPAGLLQDAAREPARWNL
jgi:hypothetical protein